MKNICIDVEVMAIDVEFDVSMDMSMMAVGIRT